MRTRRVTWGVVALALSLLWTGCNKPVQHQRAAGYTQYSAIEGQKNSTNCLYGVPAKEAGWSHGPTRLVIREGYALEHSSLDKIPLWVCEHIESGHIKGPAERADFKPDPDLPHGERAELADYRNSGYDKGHQAPAADFKYNQKRMDECFYLSNMVPQVGLNFNQSAWRGLEGRVRDCGAERVEAYVITGAMIWDPKEDVETTATGRTVYYTIGANEVAIPTHLYKIVVSKSASGTWEAVAFVMENKEYPRYKDSQYDFMPYVKSIDWIRQRTGFKFMPQLDTQDPNLQKRLESEPASELWPCLQAEQ